MSNVCRYCRQHYQSSLFDSNYCCYDCWWAATVEERKADDKKRADEKKIRESKLNSLPNYEKGYESGSFGTLLAAWIMIGIMGYIFVIQVGNFFNYLADECTVIGIDRTIPDKCKK
jgi:hypothetical protein